MKNEVRISAIMLAGCIVSGSPTYAQMGPRDTLVCSGSRTFAGDDTCQGSPGSYTEVCAVAPIPHKVSRTISLGMHQIVKYTDGTFVISHKDGRVIHHGTIETNHDRQMGTTCARLVISDGMRIAEFKLIGQVGAAPDVRCVTLYQGCRPLLHFSHSVDTGDILEFASYEDIYRQDPFDIDFSYMEYVFATLSEVRDGGGNGNPHRGGVGEWICENVGWFCDHTDVPDIVPGAILPVVPTCCIAPQCCAGVTVVFIIYMIW